MLPLMSLIASASATGAMLVMCSGKDRQATRKPSKNRPPSSATVLRPEGPGGNTSPPRRNGEKDEKSSKKMVGKKKEEKKEEKTSKKMVEMKKEVKKEEKTSKKMVGKKKEEKNAMNGFRIHAVIGTGSFGTVRLVEKMDDGKFFAMKSIKINQTTGKLDCDEVEILKNLKHPFISSLFSHFNNNGELHVVMEFCEAGDLFAHLLITRNGFGREAIKYFASSIVLAVGYLHEKLIVHRDLKPMNIMLTRQGHLKVIDFGFSKKLTTREDEMHDRVGTDGYCPPEVERRGKYGIDMDWFSVGVSLFELRAKELPLIEGSKPLMHRRINDWDVFANLLNSLTEFNPEERLGYNSTEQVKQHRFFEETDFDAILNLRTAPPYVPNMNAGLDLQWFGI